MMDYAAARHKMVENQIRTNKVTDPEVIAAMEAVPRENFVPKAKQGIAYIDEDIQIAPGRYLIEPMVLSRLLQAAELRDSDVALVIGANTGYGAAVTARLANTVVAVESDAKLAASAAENLSALHCDNAVVIDGDLAAGYPRQAPYDVIVFEGAVTQVPDAIFEQLGEGGRLVVVERGARSVGEARLYERDGAVIGHRALFDANIPYLPGFEPKGGFVF